MLNEPYGMRDEGERTDDLARLHEDYLDLKQRGARLSYYGEDLKAEMIQLIEEFETISGVPFLSISDAGPERHVLQGGAPARGRPVLLRSRGAHPVEDLRQPLVLKRA